MCVMLVSLSSFGSAVNTILLCQLGGGYLFGLPIGFVADSIGATIGATAAFLLGRTVKINKFRPYQ